MRGGGAGAGVVDAVSSAALPSAMAAAAVAVGVILIAPARPSRMPPRAGSTDAAGASARASAADHQASWTAAGLLLGATVGVWAGGLGWLVGAVVAGGVGVLGFGHVRGHVGRNTAAATLTRGRETFVASHRSGERALAADLLVATVATGVPVSSATNAVAEAVGGSIGAALVEADRLHQVGASSRAASTRLRADPRSGPIGRALRQAHDAGASPVPVLAGAAEREREQTRSERIARARSAGSIAAVPVGLAFLPAFVLVAVVPVVIGALAPMLAP